MDDALLVASLQRAAHLDQDGNRAFHGQRTTALHRPVEVPPLQIFHHDVQRAVGLQLPVLVHLHGVRVSQLAHRAGLASKARGQILAPSQLWVQDLDGHLVATRGRRGAINRAHAPGADLLEYAQLPTKNITVKEGIGLRHGRELIPEVGHGHEP